MVALVQKFVEIIIYGNAWISLGATALSLNTFLLLDWDVNINFLLLVFFATLLSYNFQRVVRHIGDDSINSNRHQWVYNQKKMLCALIIISLGVSGYLFFTLFSFYDLLYFSPLIAIALFYAVKLFSKSLRDVSFIKIILIALSWGAVTVLMPAYINQSLIENEVWLLFILNFLYIFALVIPFDIRDLNVDEIAKKTIPQLIGVRLAKITSIVLIVTCGILGSVFLDVTHFLWPVYIISILLILLVNKKRREFFYAFGIDGLILLFPVSTWIVKSYL